MTYNFENRELQTFNLNRFGRDDSCTNRILLIRAFEQNKRKRERRAYRTTE